MNKMSTGVALLMAGCFSLEARLLPWGFRQERSGYSARAYTWPAPHNFPKIYLFEADSSVVKMRPS